MTDTTEAVVALMEAVREAAYTAASTAKTYRGDLEFDFDDAAVRAAVRQVRLAELRAIADEFNHLSWGPYANPAGRLEQRIAEIEREDA